MSTDAPRIALVTGAASGIGMAASIELARRGLHVVATARTQAQLSEIERRAHGEKVSIDVRLLDVTDAEACEATIRSASPDVLVNNAAIPVAGAVAAVDDERIRRAFETNVLGPARLSRLCLPVMQERGWGRIINVSSAGHVFPVPMAGWYLAMKHTLEAFSNTLRVEADAAVRVVIIRPGGVRTAIWDRARVDLNRDGDGYARTSAIITRLEPLMMSPERVARVIGGAATIARPRSTYHVGLDAMLLRMIAATVPRHVTDRVLGRLVRP